MSTFQKATRRIKTSIISPINFPRYSNVYFFITSSQSHPEVDIEQMLCLLPEALNVSAFTQARQRVVERHSALRTCLDWQELNQPFQSVEPQAQLLILKNNS